MSAISFHPISLTWVEAEPVAPIDFRIPELAVSEFFELDRDLHFVTTRPITPEIRQRLEAGAPYEHPPPPEWVQAVSATITERISDAVTVHPHLAHRTEVEIALAPYEEGPEMGSSPQAVSSEHEGEELELLEPLDNENSSDE
jgi:hypothetical protein